ncbi:MAG: glycosyl hydrolase family 57, partial [Gammaproteobacteria bacterium]|nr:glycosyl hydrolase family 57 [Gammaproteobacteria bacterium]
MPDLPEQIQGLPNISGHESDVAAAMARGKEKSLSDIPGGVDFGRVRAAAAIALHQHQPL